MTHLKHYAYERDSLSVDTKYSKQISEAEAIGYTHLICKKLKLPIPIIDVRKIKCSKFVFYKYPDTEKQKNHFEIVYHKGYLVAGDVSHEIAHYLQYYRTGVTRHDKKMINVVAKIQKYFDTIL